MHAVLIFTYKKMSQKLSQNALLAFDQHHIWHPYAAVETDMPIFVVESAQGVLLKLADGRTLIDGMSSWWATIHGYNHPRLNAAAHHQLQKMSHVMFGGLTHEPAVQLAQELLSLLHPSLDKIFFADSGSVAVEVAMKMAIQYQQTKGNTQRHKFATIRSGYHGDTWHAMSVCDPITGMHSLFQKGLQTQFFLPQPPIKFTEAWQEQAITPLKDLLQQHGHEIAAIILEPIVQGAGGMYFYTPEYLNQAHNLCKQYDILLIFDEIATGFGRTGKNFAYEYTNITPDIICLGKALTGGYLTLSATVTTSRIAQTICTGEAKCFMHGPTFMANPLACAIATESIRLFKENNSLAKVQQIETLLQKHLQRFAALPFIKDIRVLGAIGVLELHHPVKMKSLQPRFVQHGVWIRPFGHLVYLMPPYIISEKELLMLLQGMYSALTEEYSHTNNHTLT